jgi:hypothetical protein
VALTASAAFGARTITRANAPAIAAAIALRHSDVPSLRQSANPLTARTRGLEDEAIACAGGVPLSRAWANTQSPAFQSGVRSVLAVNSGTEILPTAALVARDVAAIERPKALPCLIAELEHGLAAGQPARIRFLAAHAAHARFAVAGTDRSFAVHISVSVRIPASGKAKAAAIRVYADSIGFTVGQTEVSLAVDTTVTPPPAALERRLAAVLAARARATLR